MSNFRAEFGYGLYVDDFSKLRNGNSTFNEIEFNDEDYFVIDDDDIVSPCLFRINRKHEHQYIDANEGLVLMATDVNTRIFGDTKQTFDDIIEHLRGDFGQYLPEDFDYENNLVAYDFVRL